MLVRMDDTILHVQQYQHSIINVEQQITAGSILGLVFTASVPKSHQKKKTSGEAGDTASPHHTHPVGTYTEPHDIGMLEKLSFFLGPL